MITDYKKVIEGIKNKKYYPVYILAGMEAYYIDFISDYIANNILEKSERDFNQTIVYGKETNIGTIRESALRYPLMAEYNVIIVKEAQYLDDIEKLESYFKKPNKSSILVICYKNKKLDKRKTLYKSLSKYVCYFEGQPIYDNQLPAWIENYVKLNKFKIDERATMLIGEYLGLNLSKVANELDKLFLIKKNEKTINLNDIQRNIGISKDYNVFEIQKALTLKNHKRLVLIINYIKSNPKSNPIYMLTGVLFAYFSKLLILQYSSNFESAALSMGIRSFLFREYQTGIRNYRGKIEKVLAIIQDFDLKSKGIGSKSVEETELIKEMLFKILYI
ncbi:MAG: DNA polymerase III subunit delta [Bacteroidota bacterium]|nr:DNA polymerase III subunit delta [Bacteroidota bacterium]